MKWVLFLIAVSSDGDHLSRVGAYPTMAECFRAWNTVEQTLPRPKVNVQIICINVHKTDFIELPAQG